MEYDQAIIGISPGTYLFGFAVFRHGQLVNYGVKTYPGKWSKKKFSHIMNSLEKLLEKQTPETIVMKVADIKSTSDNVELVTAGIESLAEKKGIKVFKCALQDIKRVCCDDSKVEAMELHTYLMEQYPILSSKKSENINWHIYNRKMFEAVGSIRVFEAEM